MSLILAKSKIGKHICVFLQEQQGQNYQRQSGWEQCHVGTGALVLGGELARAFKHPMQVETSFTLNILTFENYRNDQKKKKVLCHWKKKLFFPQKYFRFTSRLGRFNSETRRCGNPRLLRSGRDSFSCHRNVHFSQPQKLHDQRLIDKY